MQLGMIGTGDEQLSPVPDDRAHDFDNQMVGQAAECRLAAAGSAANEDNPPRRATFTLEHMLEQALPRGRVVADPTTQGELLGSRLSLRIRRPRLVAGVRLLSAPRGFLTHDRC